MIDLDQGPCAIKRLRGCGCGNDYVAVDPHGDIYPCHQFVGIERWKMGNLTEGTFNDEIKTYFAKTHLYSKGGCADCWAKFYCSGVATLTRSSTRATAASRTRSPASFRESAWNALSRWLSIGR